MPLPATIAELPARAQGSRPMRSPDFLVQLRVGLDSDLRKQLGRRDIAGSREAAYGAALANRPSQQGHAAPIVALAI